MGRGLAGPSVGIFVGFRTRSSRAVDVMVAEASLVEGSTFPFRSCLAADIMVPFGPSLTIGLIHGFGRHIRILGHEDSFGLWDSKNQIHDFLALRDHVLEIDGQQLTQIWLVELASAFFSAGSSALPLGRVLYHPSSCMTGVWESWTLEVENEAWAGKCKVLEGCIYFPLLIVTYSGYLLAPLGLDLGYCDCWPRPSEMLSMSRGRNVLGTGRLGPLLLGQSVLHWAKNDF
ncbi:Hypothetical predicted protein [Prunus dulcis]|uniref:Uncharacterized protein n=1 Tax=Prunus dulcis TaxID=3755 RepID=A0A5E4GFP1_PRUDU|nr:hypothetical protein L3X38_000011 [Prunus dulcis]VVA38421.1 Hypothetical predicted protein [Prunus dulcis]